MVKTPSCVEKTLCWKTDHLIKLKEENLHMPVISTNKNFALFRFKGLQSGIII